MHDVLANKIAAITAIYLTHFGRLPEGSVFEEILASGETVDELHERILASEEISSLENAVATMAKRLEPYAGKRRVLLFGAYGNGNLGDREMAQLLANRLEQDRQIVCFAHSDLAFADYPFNPARKVFAHELVLNPRVLELFDALVIGGGGLLSYPHEPLWLAFWADLVPIPIAIAACGVAVPLDRRVMPLVQAASFLSARDARGVAALQDMNGRAELIPDVILSLAPRLAPPTREMGPIRRLFVLRQPGHGWHDWVVRHLQEGDAVALFEPHVDFPLSYCFKSVIHVCSMEDFCELASQFDLVISERYHGSVLALLCGIPAIGVTRDNHADKFEELYAALGLSDHVHAIDAVPEDLLPFPMEAASAAIERLREDGARGIERLIVHLAPDMPPIADLAPSPKENVGAVVEAKPCQEAAPKDDAAIDIEPSCALIRTQRIPDGSDDVTGPRQL